MEYTTSPITKRRSYSITSQTNLSPKNKLFEQPVSYGKDEIELNTDELVEQCLALVKAIIIIEHLGIRESLIFILEEKLIKLRSHFQ
ncbi:MAG: hypothetical protein J6562_02575 [Candidatus Schmidhempelia sp.]|nr:hypothetical protein [Candidatus Schmidhempelia sp.]